MFSNKRRPEVGFEKESFDLVFAGELSLSSLATLEIRSDNASANNILCFFPSLEVFSVISTFRKRPQSSDSEDFCSALILRDLENESRFERNHEEFVLSHKS